MKPPNGIARRGGSKAIKHTFDESVAMCWDKLQGDKTIQKHALFESGQMRYFICWTSQNALFHREVATLTPYFPRKKCRRRHLYMEAIIQADLTPRSPSDTETMHHRHRRHPV